MLTLPQWVLVCKLCGTDKRPPYYPRSVLSLLAHRARAAFRALAARSSGVILAARAGPPFFPPLRPSATAAGFFLAMR